jgi:hypothetical protein
MSHGRDVCELSTTLCIVCPCCSLRHPVWLQKWQQHVDAVVVAKLSTQQWIYYFLFADLYHLIGDGEEPQACAICHHQLQYLNFCWLYRSHKSVIEPFSNLKIHAFHVYIPWAVAIFCRCMSHCHDKLFYNAKWNQTTRVHIINKCLHTTLGLVFTE